MANLSQKKEVSQQKFDFISIEKFSELTELKKSYLYHLTSKGKLKTYKPFGKKIYLHLDEVNKLFSDSASITQNDIEAEAVNYVFNPKKK